MRSNSRTFSTTSIYMLSVTDFDPKGTISEVRVQAGPHLDTLDACWSPNAVRDHDGTTQVDFEVDRPPPANSPTGNLLITMVKETVILYKKEFRKTKKVKLVRFSHFWKWWKALDCEIACDYVKCANVFFGLLYVKTFFARKHTATHKPTSALPLKDHDDTHLTRALVAVESRRPPIRDKRRHRYCFQTRPLQAYKKSKHLWGPKSVDTTKLAYIFNYIVLHAQRHGFRPKRNFRGQSSGWR